MIELRNPNRGFFLGKLPVPINLSSIWLNQFELLNWMCSEITNERLGDVFFRILTDKYRSFNDSLGSR